MPNRGVHELTASCWAIIAELAWWEISEDDESMTEKTRSVLVTGGAGFIGSSFVHDLLAAKPDLRVLVLDKLTYAGNEENLAPVRGNPNLTFIRGDICNQALVRELMQGCQWVVN